MQFHWSDSDLRGQNESCEALAPYVMALFDGEASEDQARRARAHLLLCQSCAHRWLDWNRSRDLIRTVSVPAPPPTLMWRVLMACRLAAFSKKGSAPTTVSTASFSHESGAPDALRAQILARTTRTQVTSDVHKPRRTFPIFSVPSMAVPALALWLMVLQRDTFMATQLPAALQTSQSFESESLDRPFVAPRGHVTSMPLSVFKKHPVRQAAPQADEPTDEQDDQTSADDQSSNTPPDRPVHENRVEPRSAHLTLTRAETPRAAADDSSADISDTLSDTAADAPPALPASASPAVAPARVRSVTPMLRPATLSDARMIPPMRTASWETTTPRVAKLLETSTYSPQPVLVAVPSSKVATPPPAPRVADAVDGDDSRVDEMRSVVDDFRASLAPDDGSSDSDSGDDGSSG